LQSRFGRTVHFADYTAAELVQIFTRLGERHEYHVGDDALEALELLIAAQPRDEGFGNARYVRNIFEAAITRQAMRVAPLTDPSTEQLTTLTVADIVG
jgi:Holliday junction resolvasome RuvABC ATP-dependent DNA helicase subunit